MVFDSLTSKENKILLMRYYLLAFGVFNIFIVSFIGPTFFADLLLWTPRNYSLEMMISIVYFSMGLIMVISSKDPLASKSFIDFIILANVLHALVMFLSLQNTYQLVLDVLSIGIMGLLPLVIYPWGLKTFLKHT